MVLDILRERDQGGFGDRSDYGARLGGGIDVSVPPDPLSHTKIPFFRFKISSVSPQKTPFVKPDHPIFHPRYSPLFV